MQLILAPSGGGGFALPDASRIKPSMFTVTGISEYRVTVRRNVTSAGCIILQTTMSEAVFVLPYG